MRKIRKFEIWITDLEPGFGSEPGKTRPVVVVQSDLINQFNHSSYLICPISSQERKVKGKLRLFVKADSLNGLQKDSYILADQMRSVDLRRIQEKIGILDSVTATNLMNSIGILLDL